MKSIQEIINQIETATGIQIASSSSISGGCISNAYKVTAIDGSDYFLKINNNAPEYFFQREANGLKELKKAFFLKTPDTIITGNNFILTEFVQIGALHKTVFQEFGSQFAQMHRITSDSFGFYEDNFIGSNIQLNVPDANQKNDWVNFYFDKRLLFQIKLAEKNGLADTELMNSFIKLENKLTGILGGINEFPSLLHGDLWSGNFIITSEGQACLIDPAVYYGSREADLAMTKLFGGFNSEFYKAYDETFPLTEDFQYREDIYKLYHVLNHLNLFGGSYYYQALNIIKNYLK